MRLLCPFCGERGIEEFSYAGDATATRPQPAAPQAEWVAYVYYRDNPAGSHTELWYHDAACRRLLTVERDTMNHALLSTAV